MKYQNVIILFLCCLLLIPPYVAFAKKPTPKRPPPTSFHIDKIIIVGTETTKPVIILRELLIQENQDVDASKIETDRLRLMNLQLFNRVDIFPMKTSDSTALVIAVTERFYILPLPYANWIGPESKDYEYGFRYSQNNFRGMNRKIMASAWSGITKGFVFVYSDPWLTWTNGYGYSVQLGYSTSQEAVSEENAKQKNERFIALGSVSKRYTPQLFSRVYLGVQRMRMQKSLTLSKKYYDEMLLGKIEMIQDRRDLIELPHRGDYFNPWIDLTLFKEPAKIRSIFGIDFRQYLPLSPDWTLSAQATGLGVSGVSPRYMQTTLGEEMTVRGNPDVEVDGDYLGKVAVDLRYRLIPTQYWDWFGAPKRIAKYTRNLKYGVSVSGFSEIGQAWIKQQRFFGERYYWGYGVAITLAMPFVDVFRIDCGLNPGDKFVPNFKVSIRAGL
ncbi:MAG: hypothetical protein OEM52_04060 [bacterium]|nr:hypothetical protein [bacterium]